MPYDGAGPCILGMKTHEVPAFDAYVSHALPPTQVDLMVEMVYSSACLNAGDPAYSA